MGKNKLKSYQPLNTLKQVDESIWIADGEMIHMKAGPFTIPFTTRMTVVKLSDGSLWVHSPIAPDKKLIDEVNNLGKVKHLISPNKIHYAFIKDWKVIYPEAIAWSSPGVEKRASSQNIPVAFDDALTGHAPKEWEKDISQLLFKGGRVVQEVVFFHHNSKTLILTDLIENVEAEKVNSSWMRTLYSFAGIKDPDGKTPIDYRASFIGNKQLAKESYKEMLAWEPDKIILAHGRWYDKNGTDELKRAFRWLDK